MVQTFDEQVYSIQNGESELMHSGVEKTLQENDNENDIVPS